VQVQSVGPRQQRIYNVEVFAQLIRRARLAGVISRRRDSASQVTAWILEAAYIISLPAMQADGNFFKALKGLFGIDSKGSITLLRQVIGVLDVGM
jgi:hypothetical protein